MQRMHVLPPGEQNMRVEEVRNIRGRDSNPDGSAVLQRQEERRAVQMKKKENAATDVGASITAGSL